MALRETPIQGIHADIDGTPITSAWISITPDKKMAYSSTHSIPDKKILIQTHPETGAYAATLWAEEDDSLVAVKYEAMFPIENGGQPDKDHTGKFSLPYSTEALDLPSLIAAEITDESELGGGAIIDGGEV